MRIESRLIEDKLEAVLLDGEEILCIFPRIEGEGETKVKIPEFIVNYRWRCKIMIDKHIKPPQIILPPKPKKPEKFEV
tara:strand:- start:2809 stop:3042 length:234 start_codon:yes stop_codon:yes gene_type:complete